MTQTRKREELTEAAGSLFVVFRLARRFPSPIPSIGEKKKKLNCQSCKPRFPAAKHDGMEVARSTGCIDNAFDGSK